FTNASAPFVDLVDGHVEIKPSWSVGGRLGYLITPSSLLYGTAGYTRTEVNVLDSFDDPSRSFNGYFVGAGLETFLHPNWTLKFEYRFSQYEDKTMSESAVSRFNLDPSTQSARVVLSYKFGQRD